ncbi:DUF3108 domain-containing protein [Thalassotalea euphylliae]|uniref:DUF3108 domain-containing protein n=1 Tax=Thalassotalea euphylliae TaxID=1655234 RepID=UPI003640F3C7
MVNKIAYTLTACLVFISANVSADHVEVTKQIKPFTATYNVLRDSEPVGKGVRQLKYLENGTAEYSYHTDIEWLIFSDKRAETSVIELTNGHVTPTHYLYKREGTGKDKYYEWTYDVKNGVATDLKKKREKQITFPPNIQDKLSYHFQHRLNLMANPKQGHFVYPVVSTSGKVKNYVYQYDGEEEVMLPYGLVKTIRLKREVVDKKRITYAWFAPELDYLMVKLYQTKGGVEQFEAQLTKVEIQE